MRTHSSRTLRIWIQPWWLALTLLVTAAAWSAHAQQDRRQSEWQVVERRSAKGEQCLVCGTPLESGEVIELRYKGRTFHLMPEMLEQFSGDPQQYFAKLQARSALFDERSANQAIHPAWLWAGLYLLAGLIGAALCGYLAVSKSLSPLPWFFAGLVGNAAAVVILLLTPGGDASAQPAGVPSGLAKVPLTRSPINCRACGAENHPAASLCSACGAALQPLVEAETRRV